MIKSKCVDRDRQTKSLVSHKLQTHMEQEQEQEPKMVGGGDGGVVVTDVVAAGGTGSVHVI